MTEEKNYAKEQAGAQYESIREMVAALGVDYDRLEELREEYHDLDQEDHDEMLAWQEVNAEEFKELSDAAGSFESRDEVYERIQEDPLSVRVRSGWVDPGGDMEAEEFEILLCTGGPAVRVLGELDERSNPSRAWIEYQDWGTPWTPYFNADEDILLAYCSNFYFGG